MTVPLLDPKPQAGDVHDGDEAVVDSILGGVDEGRAGVVEAGSFCLAVSGTAGQILWTDAGFADLIEGDNSELECRALVTLARSSGHGAGLVATARGPIVMEARAESAAGGWPLSEAARAALRGPGERFLLVAFAPSRSVRLTLSLATALGLTPRESDLAAALLEAPNLKIAAARAGMSADTAKETLQRACRRLGVSGASELVGRLLDLACGGLVDEAAAADTLGLTKAEARVASAVAKGWSTAHTAAALDLTEATVKTQRKLIFAKTGASRDRDLRRLFLEASRLAGLKGAAEVVLEDRAVSERLRIVGRPDGRRVALVDYGPASARALMVMHGFTTGRRLPARFVARLQRDGWRPLAVQRPGFGLTDPAKNDYLAEGAGDMAAVLEALGASQIAILARDAGVAMALAFAARHPDLWSSAAIVNPKSTRDRPASGLHPLPVLSRLLMSRASLIAVAAEGLRRRSADAQARVLLQRLYASSADDAPPEPDILDHVVRDTQAMLARTARGLIDELRVYAEGWRPPDQLPAGPWRVAWGSAMWSPPEAAAWEIAGAKTSSIEGLGLLGAYTHPDELADLLAPPR